MKTLMEIMKKQRKTVVTADHELEIASLKEQLDSTDYKVIKCSEFSLAKIDAPYDIAAVHAERQQLRDKINALESEIASIE